MGSAGEYTKAVIAALGAGLAVLLVAVGADSAGGGDIVVEEWIKCAIAIVAVGAAVWGVPNSVTQEVVEGFLAKDALTKRAKVEASKDLIEAAKEADKPIPPPGASEAPRSVERPLPFD